MLGASLSDFHRLYNEKSRIFDKIHEIHRNDCYYLEYISIDTAVRNCIFIPSAPYRPPGIIRNYKIHNQILPEVTMFCLCFLAGLI